MKRLAPKSINDTGHSFDESENTNMNVAQRIANISPTNNITRCLLKKYETSKEDPPKPMNSGHKYAKEYQLVKLQ